jgi:protein phosphatase
MKIDIIGDIHGCLPEFKKLTNQLGYNWDSGIPLHPDNRVLGFVGDLTDRGPASLQVAEIVWRLVIEQKKAYYTPGNHAINCIAIFLAERFKKHMA